MEPFTRLGIVRVRGADRGPADDVAATEAPLELRVQGRPLAVIMRTPGGDRELAAGFLLAERIIRRADDLGTIEVLHRPERSGRRRRRVHRQRHARSRGRRLGRGGAGVEKAGDDQRGVRRLRPREPRIDAYGPLAGGLRRAYRCGRRRLAAGASPGPPAALRVYWRDPRRGYLRRRRRAIVGGRGRRPAQRRGQGHRAGCCSGTRCRSRPASSASAAARRSRSCRRPGAPASRSSRQCRRPRAWPCRWRPRRGSRWSASSAAAASTSTPALRESCRLRSA